MRAAERENSIEVLRAFSLFLQEDNERLRKENARLQQLESDAAQLKLDYEQKLSRLREIFFKRGRERSGSRDPEAKNDQELLLHSQNLIPEPKPEDTEALPQETLRHEATAEQLAEALHARVPGLDADFQAEWKELGGFTEDSVEITIIERKFVKIQHQRQKYKTTVTDPKTKEEREIIVAAPGPEKLSPGCNYSIDFATAVVVDKFLMHLPLDRVRRQMGRQGLEIDTKTLYNLTRIVGEVHLAPIATRIRAEILAVTDVAVHIDDTPWAILNSKDSDGRLWTISNRVGAYFVYQPGRSGAYVEELLKGYSGPIVGDKLSGYNRFKEDPPDAAKPPGKKKLNVKLCYCRVGTGVTPPSPSQTRTCATNASGSSNYGFAA